MMVNRVNTALLVAAWISTTLCMSSAALADDTAAGQSLEQALRQSDLILDWRMRHESVDHDAFDATARAGTGRLRLGFRTAPFHSTTLLAEGVWIAAFVDDYNSTTNGQTTYPVVADPAGFTAVNRFALTNTALPDTRLTLGRQRIVIDDARFVGNVGWRQNEQTFDGLRAEWSPAAWTVDLTWANQVNRIFGPESPAGRWRGDFWIGHAGRDTPLGRVTLFAHRVQPDEALANASDTAGLKLNGNHAFARVSLLYSLAWATQRDSGDNPFDYSARYTLVEAGVRRGPVTVALGREQLGSGGTRAFTTPLATLHAFLGWADLFLDTPADGITDRYARVVWQRGATGPFDAMNVTAIAHVFDAARGSARYGDELNLQLNARIKRSTLGIKHARYAADTFGTDVRKWWVSMDYAL